MPHILRLGQNIGNCAAAPCVPFSGVKIRLMFPHAALCKVIGRPFNLFQSKDTGNFIRTFALQRHAVNPAYYLGGFLVDNPVVFVVGVFLIAIDTMAVCMLAGHSSCAENACYFSAAVTHIPFVHNVQKRGKLAAFALVAVNSVCYGNKTDAPLLEHDFCVKSHLQIISADTT